MPWTEKSERARTPVVPSRSDVLKQDRLQSFKTRRVGFATDGKNSERARMAVVPSRRFSFCHGRQNSERARTPVVPSRSDVLKQDRLQSFKTRRVGFDMDVKTNP
ncbi:hypothetical protein FUT84_06300 [Treponema phagedenis]|nr:hypothetical protein FUT84_06300 [Treponema phagedenis]QEK05825.1 hypothetical protein FUT80_03215 [Treponema phagedenis]